MDYEAEQHRHRRALLGHDASCRSPAPTSTPSTRRARCRSTGRRALNGRTSTCCCAIATTRRTPRSAATTARQEAGAAAQAARGRLGHPPAQQGAALRARSAAERRHQAGHARRQGRHRQDAARASPPACRRSSRSSVYSKLLVSRPIFPLGRDIGYLPGDIEEKLNPWMQPIYDNVEFLMGLSKPSARRRAQLPRADRPRATSRSSR